MPSPFPGMDPYIESSKRWGDFHANLIASMRNELNARLPQGYAAETDQYVWIVEPGSPDEWIEPDIYVAETRQHTPSRRARPRAGRVAPLTVTLPKKLRRRRKYLRILDLESNRVVTAIEVLSPSNKLAGPDRTSYLVKRDEYLASPISFVEIDLLRCGKRFPLGAPFLNDKDYCVFVVRPWEYPHADLWAFGIRDALPEILIPVTEEVPDVTLPLRLCVDRVYDGGRYGERLPYDRPLSPRLRGPDAAWVRELLGAKTSA